MRESGTPSIRPALPSEAERISALALPSKAHWNYTTEQLEVFRDELTLRPDQIAPRRTHVLEMADRILGFYTLVPRQRREIELEHIFVEPSALHRGLGRALFVHACNCASAAGFDLLLIQSDPNAAGFYHALGARLIREIPSSIPGRVIPYFTLTLSE